MNYYPQLMFSAKSSLERALNEATCYEEWCEAAKALDKKNGLDRWKRTDASKLYDFRSIKRRTSRLRKLRKDGDNFGLLFALNEGIHGNMDGIGNAELYSRAHFGTKRLIASYVNEVAGALEHLADPSVYDISLEKKLDFFHRAQRCFGRTALMLSGAGSLLFFHFGVIKALLEHDLLPHVLSGSSGGSVAGGLVCTHDGNSIEDLFDPENIVREIEEPTGLAALLAPITPEIMPIEDVQAGVERLIPDMTFQQAFDKTGRYLNISIAPAEEHQNSRLLNAITSPNVCLREAVLASCAVPGIYPPVSLAAINDHGERQVYLPSRLWVDGSVSDDLPAKRLARLFGVNHFVVSQTNPHVLPFKTTALKPGSLLSSIANAGRQTAREWINVGADVLSKPLSVSPALTRATNIAMSVINQDYIGDITITPDARFFNPMKLLANRSAEDIIELMKMGERATWPKIETIRMQTTISRLLDRITLDFELREHKLIEKLTAQSA